MDYEIYQAETGHRKQYLVFESTIIGSAEIAKKYFKCGFKNLQGHLVWINGKDLYLENPHIKGFHKRYAISYYSTRRSDDEK